MTLLTLSEKLLSISAASSLKSILLALLCILLVLTISLRELLKPVDKYTGPHGKPWRLPPGPGGWPILGNLLLYRKGAAAAHKIAEYGEMTTTHLGSKLWVVLNTDRVAKELYDRKGTLTNGRPPYPIADGMISRGGRSVILPTKDWSEPRRVMHQLLSGSAMSRYQEYQDDESVVLLQSYLTTPEQWYLHHMRYSSSVIHRVTTGERPHDTEETINDVMKAQHLFLQNAPPLCFWDCFPALAKLPRALQWWRHKYEAIGKFTVKAYSAYWGPIKTKIEAGAAAPSFARDLVLGEAKYSGSELDQMFLALQLIEAGTETTRLAINIFALAAVSYPAKFLKARAEIDALCGSNGERLPDFQDETFLPYVNAFVKEMLRWRGIFMWTPEHTLSEDMEFEGYHFPKGTNFVLNHLAISNDPKVFERPEDFEPQRYLNGNEGNILNGLWQFGGGRRVCVGYKLAHRSLFLNVSRIIYCFDYEMRAPVDNRDINHFTLGEPFPIFPRIRSPKFADLIQRTVASKRIFKQ